jgi:hypothetical protein
MRFRAKQTFVTFAVLALATPIWARSKSLDFNTTEPTTIGTTQLSPGSYQLRAKENGTQVDVLKGGKIVAEVPCHWVQLDKKADQSEVLLNSNRVTELDFGGSTQAARF